MMNQYLKVFIMLFFLWCLYNYINCKKCKEGFIVKHPRAMIFDGRNIPYKKCLNDCTGKRYCGVDISQTYNSCINNCNPLQHVSTHDPSSQFDFYNKW